MTAQTTFAPHIQETMTAINVMADTLKDARFKIGELACKCVLHAHVDGVIAPAVALLEAAESLKGQANLRRLIFKFAPIGTRKKEVVLKSKKRNDKANTDVEYMLELKNSCATWWTYGEEEKTEEKKELSKEELKKKVAADFKAKADRLMKTIYKDLAMGDRVPFTEAELEAMALAAMKEAFKKQSESIVFSEIDGSKSPSAPVVEEPATEETPVVEDTEVVLPLAEYERLAVSVHASGDLNALFNVVTRAFDNYPEQTDTSDFWNQMLEASESA